MKLGKSRKKHDLRHIYWTRTPHPPNNPSNNHFSDASEGLIHKAIKGQCQEKCQVQNQSHGQDFLISVYTGNQIA